MESGRSLFGLTAQAKAKLLEKLSSAAQHRAPAPAPAARRGAGRLDISELQGYRDLRTIEAAGDYLGIDNPFFRVHEGIAGAETVIGNRPYVNFASYNYIGLNGDPRIATAVARRRSSAMARRSARAAPSRASGRCIASWTGPGRISRRRGRLPSSAATRPTSP